MMARDYKHEYATYQGKPEQIKHRAERNMARRELEKAGRAHKGDGKDVGHKKSLRNGGSNRLSNVRVQSVASNRGWRRGKSSYNPD
jgi:hypothetical protein